MDMKVIKHKLKVKLQNSANNIKLRRYYNEKTGRGKTYTAIILDKIIFRGILLVALLFTFYFATKSPLFSLIITIQVFALYNIIMYKVNKARFLKKTIVINKQVIVEKTLSELLNQTPHDFLDYIINILDKYGFDSITRVDGKDIDFIGTMLDKKIGIKCLQYDIDYKVGVNIVRDFFISIRKFELNEGVIITTSTFSQESKGLLSKMKKHAKIQLIDIEGLVGIIKKTDLYPTELEVKKIILDKISDTKMNLKSYGDVILSKGKIIKYIILGISMIIFGKFTPYTMYYNIVAFIIFALAIVSIVRVITGLLMTSEAEREDNVL